MAMFTDSLPNLVAKIKRTENGTGKQRPAKAENPVHAFSKTLILMCIFLHSEP